MDRFEQGINLRTGYELYTNFGCKAKTLPTTSTKIGV